MGGKDCKYRHALPPGFVLKKDKKKEEKKEEISIEELVEQKRAELSAQNKSLTPITLQTFVAWKKRKLREKKAKEQKENEDKKKKMKQGFTVGMSGRDMFMFDPKMVSNEVKKSSFPEIVKNLTIFLFRTMMKKVVKPMIWQPCPRTMTKTPKKTKSKSMKLNLMSLASWMTG